jgi:hypothetical protein
MRHRPAPRVAWLGAAAILVAAALVALAAVLRGDFSDTDGRILGTLAAVLYCGGALFAGLSTVDRGRPWIGWAVAGFAPVCFVTLTIAMWEIVFEGDDDPWRWGWSAVLALLAGIMVATALLLAHAAAAVRLAYAAGAGAGLAALLSITAIWHDDEADSWIKTIAALWILSVLAYVLVPVTDRFTRARPTATAERVLAVLDGVELVATTAPGIGTIDPGLAPGERLVLRPAR